MSSKLEQLYQTSHLYGGNASYIEGWYETWLKDPAGVPEQWCKYFESMPASDQPETGHIEVGVRFRNLSLSQPACVEILKCFFYIVYILGCTD